MEENIAIIILNYQNYALSEECVNNLIELGIKSRIVIVDNNSKNDSYEYLKSHFELNKNVDVIKNSINAGYAAGNNFGIRHVLNNYEDIKYIAVMNPDVILTYSDVLMNLVKKLDDNADLALISAMMVGRESLNFQTIYWNIPTDMELLFEHLNWTNSIFNKRNNRRIPLSPDRNGLAKVEVVPGSFFMIKRNVLEEIGMFDEGTFLYNEENILAIELKKRGYKEALSINDFYIHNHNPSASQKNLKQWYELAAVGYKSRQCLCSKYDNKKILSRLLAIVQGLNYFEITVRYMGSFIKRKIRGQKNL